METSGQRNWAKNLGKMKYFPKLATILHDVRVVNLVLPFSQAPVAQRYHVTSDTLGREFDPGKRDFSH